MKKKTVTNLLCDIGKARDLIQEKDFKELYKNIALFYRIEVNATKQVQKFYKEDGKELDFNMYDLQELSNEAYQLLDELAKILRFDGYKKDMYEKEKQVTLEVYDAYCLRWSKIMQIDAFLRSMAKRIAFLAVGLEFLEEKKRKAKEKEINKS